MRNGREILRLTICIEHDYYYFLEVKKRIVDCSVVAFPNHGVWLELKRNDLPSRMLL